MYRFISAILILVGISIWAWFDPVDPLPKGIAGYAVGCLLDTIFNIKEKEHV